MENMDLDFDTDEILAAFQEQYPEYGDHRLCESEETDTGYEILVDDGAEEILFAVYLDGNAGVGFEQLGARD